MLRFIGVLLAGLALMTADAFGKTDLDALGKPEVPVDPAKARTLRTCADPNNLPFSNSREEGFENRLAELVAGKLNKGLLYSWFPQATGFVRNTLGAHKCDVIMGMPRRDDLVRVTKPYYHSAYSLIYRRGGDLDGVAGLGDDRLRGKRVGIVAGTPPAGIMAANGLMVTAKSYPLVIDTRVDSPAAAMLEDITAGNIDAGVLWGPLAGYYAGKSNIPVKVVPLAKEPSRVPLDFWIGMGVRSSDEEFAQSLETVIQENRPEIRKILMDFHVPLLN